VVAQITTHNTRGSFEPKQTKLGRLDRLSDAANGLVAAMTISLDQIELVGIPSNVAFERTSIEQLVRDEIALRFEINIRSITFRFGLRCSVFY
jgi:hypothetical protein